MAELHREVSMSPSNRGTMITHARDYLAQRRSTGFGLETDGALLLNFVQFAERVARGRPLTARLALRWATQNPAHTPETQARRLTTIRGFARYMAARDVRTEVPGRALVPVRLGRKQPHIFTGAQLRQLVQAATPRGVESLRWSTYTTMLGLLASTGLRVSEALGFTVADVDLEDCVLRVHETKFRKSRLVPVHPSVTREMRRYKRQRDEARSARSSPWFFAGRGYDPLPYHSIHSAFRQLCTRFAWQGNGAFANPRIHDLRHTFACRRLLSWYRRGVDVGFAMSSLATYLGHTSVIYTYWYLTGTHELLSIAGNRFERFFSTQGRLP